MDQALREVSEEFTTVLIHFLGVEADVVRESEELLHQLSRLVDVSRAGERINQPERAAQERSLAPSEAILTGVAIQQRAVSQLAPDCGGRGGHQRISPRGVVHEGAKQQTRVELVAVRRSHVATTLL